MTPQALIAALEASGMTQSQIGVAVGVKRVTVSRWKHGVTVMPQAARMVLSGLLKKGKKDE